MVTEMTVEIVSDPILIPAMYANLKVNWQPMPTGAPPMLVPLPSTSQEYKMVEANIKQTAQGLLRNIFKVRTFYGIIWRLSDQLEP